MGSRVSTLETHLGYWLRLVSNHVSHEFSRKLQERQVTVAEWVVLRKLLEAAPLAPSQLADALGLTRGAISKLNERLLQKGLIEIAGSRTDGRQQVISLTRRGQALVPQLAAVADTNDAEFFDVLSEPEQATLRKLLMKLVHSHELGGVPVDYALRFRHEKPRRDEPRQLKSSTGGSPRRTSAPCQSQPRNRLWHGAAGEHARRR